MQMKLCSICGKPTVTGGLCYEHGKACYDYAEMKYWEMLEEREEEEEKKYQEEDEDE